MIALERLPDRGGRAAFQLGFGLGVGSPTDEGEGQRSFLFQWRFDHFSACQDSARAAIKEPPSEEASVSD